MNYIIKYLSDWIAIYCIEHAKEKLLVRPQGAQGAFVRHLCSKSTEVFHKLRIIEYNDFHDAVKIADETNAIIIGNVDKTYGSYLRQYHKVYDSADIYPIFDIDLSDIIKINSEIFPGKVFDINQDYQMIEFCNKLEDSYKIITSTELPNKHPKWKYLIQEQKECVAKMHYREKVTRHKAITRPFPKKI